MVIIYLQSSSDGHEVCRAKSGLAVTAATVP